MTGERCLIEAMAEANNGAWDSIRYVNSKIQDVARPFLGNQAGGIVECDACKAIFRLNPGGVYLEFEGEQPCDRPDGMKNTPSGYQLNLHYQRLL